MKKVNLWQLIGVTLLFVVSSCEKKEESLQTETDKVNQSNASLSESVEKLQNLYLEKVRMNCSQDSNTLEGQTIDLSEYNDLISSIIAAEGQEDVDASITDIKRAISEISNTEMYDIPESILKSSATNPYFERGNYGSTSDNTSLSGFVIYRPDNMNAGPYPIVSWGNGTGSTSSIYRRLFNHLASHGFVIVASQSTMTGSGTAIKNGIDKMIELNSKSSSKYYQKLDVNNIGVFGHSQGGYGATNAALKNDKVDALIAIAPAPFPFTTSGINCPTFIITGSLDMICSPTSVRRVYSGINSRNSQPYLYSTKRNADHITWIFSSDGNSFYGNINLWFSAFLKNDSIAKSYFASGGEFQRDNSWMSTSTKNL